MLGANTWEWARTPGADSWDQAWTLCVHRVVGANSGFVRGRKANRK
jgi:hypothetical protein